MPWNDPRLQDTITFLTLWAACVVFLLPLQKRPRPVLRAALFGAAAAALGPLIGLPPQLLGLLPLSVGYLFTVLFFLACGEMGPSAALYCGVWAMLSQQLIAELFFILRRLTTWLWHWQEGAWLALMLALFAVGYCALGLTVARWMPREGRYIVGPRQLTAALVLLGIFELLFLLMSGGYGFPNELLPITIFLAQFYCATMLYLQYALFRSSAMRRELDILNRLSYQQKEQYQLARETIDIINRKCHDLKHQMAAMRCIADSEEREHYLKEIQDSVRIYDAIVKTGNEVLDTVLTEKSLTCGANGITIHCVADGSLLGFMDPIDLYAIFGNALDNAIEEVQALRDPEQRLIDVLVCTERQFLVIRVINPQEGELTFEDGLPLSTKPADGYHGFGLKSIRHTVEKYGGFLTVTSEDRCFVLRILIPLPG